MAEVYAIKQNTTGKFYVGSTTVAEYRIKAHLSNLKSNRHSNKYLQSDFNKYGFDFTYYILERNIRTDYEARKLEYLWMNILQSNIPDKGYNLSKSERPIDFNLLEQIEIKYTRGNMLDKGFDKKEVDNVRENYRNQILRTVSKISSKDILRKINVFVSDMAIEDEKHDECWIYDNLKDICKERGITFQQIEEQAELGTGCISRWRNNKVSPRVDTLKKVADVVGVRLVDLVAE